MEPKRFRNELKLLLKNCIYGFLKMNYFKHLPLIPLPFNQYHHFHNIVLNLINHLLIHYYYLNWNIY